MPRQVFHSKDYEQREHSQDPVVQIKIANNEPINAYVDTGCAWGLALTKRQMRKLGLDLGEKINDEPIKSILADGSLVGTDYYIVEVEVGGENREVRVSVIDPERKFGISTEELDDEPLVGRHLLDHFDVTFSGIDKRLTFFK